jgi:hypothetical protein
MNRTQKLPKKRTRRLINIEASESWLDWLNGLSEHAGFTKAATIDIALRHHAEKIGYRPKPPKR